MTRRAAATAVAIASAVAIAGCGLGAGKATSGVMRSRSRATSAAAPVGSVTEKNVAGLADRDADARALVQGHDALRRRVRRVDRRPRRQLVAARLVLLRQRDRGDARRRRHLGPPRRPDLVGPARLDRDRLDPGGRRLVPRAVHARHRRPAPARPRSSAPPTSPTACQRVTAELNAVGVPVAEPG